MRSFLICGLGITWLSVAAILIPGGSVESFGFWHVVGFAHMLLGCAITVIGLLRA